MALDVPNMNGEVEVKKALLEQQYITLLERRVAQLQKLASSSENEKSGRPAENEDEANSAVGGDDASTSAAPLTKDNLAKVAGGAAKASETLPKDGARVRHVVSKFNEQRGSRVDIPIDKENLQDEAKRSECLLRNVMDASDPKMISHCEVDLGPGPLLELLIEILREDANDPLPGNQHTTLASPFMQLVHNWDKLKEEAETEKAGDTSERKEARADLAQVLDFVQCSKGLESYFKTRASNRSSEVINYNDLWTIFAVGTEVVTSTFLEDKQIMIVGDPPYLFAEEKSQSLWCWYYDHDGTNWIVAEVEFEIDRYTGTKSIDTLPCYPLEFYKQSGEKPDLAKLRAGFIERGKRFKELCTATPGVGQMFDYNGQLLSVEKPFKTVYSNDSMDEQNSALSASERKPDPSSFKKATIDGRILVDPKSFLDHAPVGLVIGERQAWLVETKEKRYDINEERKYLITPPRVLGWSTIRKSWCEFTVNEVKAARAANHAIFENELQLDENVKKMIKALVEQHNSKGAMNDVRNPDLIEGKGRGLVILLHGPPGVGKTLTAEAIAEKTGRPLLNVSVAEIGLNASRAERNLERQFKLASRWEAILLVDEADVFLEARMSQADPNRNALVSVLLRVLEYYQGIIILTTNRITSLDVAVQSRIHLAVRFDDLDQNQMRSILTTILQRFNVKESDKEDILRKFNEYLHDNSRLRFNGRQIRNMVFSAHALALSAGERSIQWGDIREVLRVTREFQEQLAKIVDEQRYLREAKKGPN